MCESIESLKTHQVLGNNILPDDGIIVIEDDEILDEMQFNSTKPEFIKNVDVLMKEIGVDNYNDILDALCSISNIRVKANALNALFSCDKEIQSRKVQTEIHCSEESSKEVISMTKVPTSINYQPQVVDDMMSHVFFDDYVSEVIVESQYQGETIVTGEGELRLNNQTDSPSIKFILKGDGAMNHNPEED